MAQQQMTSFEFYQTKKDLPAGVYTIIEHDGEINMVRTNGFGEEVWSSVSEFEDQEQ